jgi:hypothetical protein
LKTAAAATLISMAGFAAAQFGDSSDARNAEGNSPGRSFQQVFNAPEPVMSVLRRSCFDCHSQETRWPWYSRLPLVGTELEKHVRQGRLTLNFSRWETDAEVSEQADLVAGLCETVNMGLMPLRPYLVLHPFARVSREEAKTLCDWSAAAERKLLESE